MFVYNACRDSDVRMQLKSLSKMSGGPFTGEPIHAYSLHDAGDAVAVVYSLNLPVCVCCSFCSPHSRQNFRPLHRFVGELLLRQHGESVWNAHSRQD